ncbi:MAG: ribulose-phosphate 3-epimerase [Bacteroidales bacterium]|nr:ribulose-phosphate 3-epimerase [Bacteroidales bacterium]
MLSSTLNDMLVAPSILAADFLHLSRDVKTVNRYADFFHLDIMDGTFVPNISFGFPVVEAIAREARKPMDVHLMIVHPDKYVERFAKAGAAMISFHYEAALEESGQVIEHIRELGVKPGIVINPDCPVEKIFPYLGAVDYVLLMSVFAGFGGQRFIEDTYGRVRAVKAEIVRHGSHALIEVDGGVSPSNAGKLAEAGVDIAVAGSAVFKAEDPGAVIAAIRGCTPLP